MKLSLLSACVLSVFLGTVYARPISSEELKEKSEAGLQLIKLGDDLEPEWMTEEEVFALIREQTDFVDLTYIYERQSQNEGAALRKTAVEYTAPSHQAEVNAILDTVSLANMQAYLAELSSFHTRWYRSTTGVDATNWIVDTVQDIIDQNPSVGAFVVPYAHPWPQSSIIATIPGTSDGPLTIIGAHMDSVNSANPTGGRAPGVDDDGSGSVNLLEAFRALVTSGFTPSTPVQFQWYSGEEAGLLGSADIATNYSSAGVDVKGMLQLDMTAYFRPGTEEVVALIPDRTDATLTQYIGSLVDEYLSIPWVIGPQCGYGCSDHASWNSQGYPSAFPFETRFGQHNPVIHTASDTASATGFSWSHSLEYTKLAVAYVYELAF